jgi:hypothetical protein
VLLTDGPLSFREFMTHEETPLATIFREVLQWLAGRNDAVLFGAHAVNAYCEVERMTHDVDLLSTNSTSLAEEIRGHLANRFHIAVRVHVVSADALRVYQVREPKNRHLVDIRQIDQLPEYCDIAGVHVIAPAELVARKVLAMAARHARPKGATDLADVERLLLAFPDLKIQQGLVAERLRALGASPAAMRAWMETVERTIEADDEET